MEEDPGTLLLGGMIGSGSLLLAWAIVQLGHALTVLNKTLAGGVTVYVEKVEEGHRRKGA